MTLARTLLLAAACVPAACGGEGPREPIRRVILVTCDTLRPDRLGAYGYGRPTSPNVDALAADATLFERAYSAAPLTGPSMSSLFTGKMPDEIGISRGNFAVLSPEAVTLPEILSEAGIDTAAVVSNTVLGRPPPRFGDAGISQGFAAFDDVMREKEANRDFYERTGEPTTDAAIAMLTRQLARPEPRSFLWVHYQDPHGPYTPPPERVAQFLRPPSPDEPEIPIGKTNKTLGQIPAYQVLAGERHPGPYRDRYDAEIATFDAAFGRLLAWLREHGLYEDSLIVFTADHGESLGEHGYWFGHGSNLYREELAVPLIVRFPGGRRGERRPDRACHLDLWPTILEAYGLPARANRGTSLFAASLPSDRLLPHSLGRPGEKGRWTAVTSDRFRLILEEGTNPRLFDLRADPTEAKDLASEQAEVVQELLAGCRTHFGPRAIPVPELFDPNREKALKGLGYTDGTEEH